MQRARHTNREIERSHESTKTRKSERNLGIRLIFLISMCVISCGPSLVEVFLECPSPDRKLIAVVWAEAGGGAAGWSQELVSIQGADVPIEGLHDRRNGEQSAVLAINSTASAFGLKWHTNDRLFITVTYSEQPAVFKMAEEQRVNGRLVHVSYQELKSDNRFSTLKSTCQSGSQRIENPQPRRLK